VLDFQIKELKRQIEPRENDIAQLNAQVAEVDRELERFHHENGVLESSVASYKAKLVEHQEALRKSVAAQRGGALVPAALPCPLRRSV
jgi:uncharacterized protein (DUF3084 family)